MKIVITDSACELLVGSGAIGKVLGGGTSKHDEGVVAIESDSSSLTLICSGREDSSFFYAVIERDELVKIPGDAVNDAFARINRVLRSVSRTPVRLPTSWAEYHLDNTITFFAVPEVRNKQSLRWIAEIRSDGAVFFAKITTRDNPTPLSDYVSEEIPSYRKTINDLIKKVRAQRVNASLAENTEEIVQRVDFDTVGSSAISLSMPFEEWMDKLSAGQKEVLKADGPHNIRIIGAAGSGKTAALCLRAIKDVRDASSSGVRVLFATHSWAMAERIDGALSALNSGEVPSEIEVSPLLQVLRDVLKGEFIGGISVLGDDSTDGRSFQVDLIEELLTGQSSVDMAAFVKQGLREEISQAITAGDTRILAENLYQEFNGVLLAMAVRPSDKSKMDVYLKMERSGDMPPFTTRGDLLFVLHIYRSFIAQLREWGFVTTDQLVSDAMRVLETFAWDVKRDSLGYDIIFVDELQLFGAQERMALTLLSRSQDKPIFVTAEDPSQGVFAAVSPAWRNGAVLSKDSKPIELSTVHRFNKGILALVKHIYMSFPLNAGAIAIEAGSSANEGAPPLLFEYDNYVGLEESVVSLVREMHRHGGSVAVISINYDSRKLANRLKENIPNIVLVESLDDIEQLTYRRKSIVVGGWSFLGGTQFDRVIVIGDRLGAGQTAFDRMRDLVSLYVAASRASKELKLVLTQGVPDVIARAEELGLVVRSS